MDGSFYGYTTHGAFDLEIIVELGTLWPETDYNFTYVAINAASACTPVAPNFHSQTTFRTGTPSLPEASNNVYQADATGGGIKVAWDPPLDQGSNSTIYTQIYMTKVGSSSPWQLVYNSTGTTYWKTQLLNGADYQFRASFLNEIGYSPNTSDYVFTTAYLSVPGPVSNISLVSRTGGMVYLAWAPPDDNGGSTITGYDVTGNSRTITVQTNETSFGGLLANTSYDFTVNSRNDLGPTLDGQTATFSTSPVTLPSQVDSVEVVSSTGGSTILQVTLPSDTGGVSASNLNYLVYANGAAISAAAIRLLTSLPSSASRRLMSTDQYSLIPDGFAGDVIYRRLTASDISSSSAVYLQVGSLLPQTSYTFTLALGNTAGNSNSSAGVPVATASVTVPGTPDAPKASSITGGSISFAWCDPVDTGGLPLTSYILTVTYLGDTFVQCIGIQLSCTVGNLQSLTEYTASLVVYNSVGASSPSKTVTVTTEVVSLPQEPLDPVVKYATYDSVSVEWQPCADFGGSYVDTYLIRVVDTDGSSNVTANVSIDQLTAVVNGLNPGTDYYATVVGLNCFSSCQLDVIDVSLIFGLDCTYRRRK